LRKTLGPFLGDKKVIELKCTSGECTNLSEPEYVVIETPPPAIVTIIVIAVLGVAATVALGALVVVLAKKTRRFATISADVDDEAEKLMESGHHVPATLVFRNICYDVLVDGQLKRVLKGVYGVVKPGEVLAIMGSSGKFFTLSVVTYVLYGKKSWPMLFYVI
jgi:hypothetical protein